MTTTGSTRSGRASAEQPQRAGGAERVVAFLAQVVHGAAEPRTVAEVLLDLLGEVVDADVHLTDAVADEAEDDPVDDRPPADGHQRLRRVLGQPPEPGPRAAGHDHRDVGQPLGADDVGKGVQPDDSRLGVDLGHRGDPQGPHEVEDERTRRSLAHDVRARRRVRQGRVVDAGAGQEGAPHVAVGDDTDDPSAVVDEHAHRRRVPVDDLHDLPERRGRAARRPARGLARSCRLRDVDELLGERRRRCGADHLDDARRGSAVAVGVDDLG